MILLVFWFQMIDKGWFTWCLIVVIVTVLLLLYYILVVPESAKWLYTKKRFREAREVLLKVARFNAAEPKQIEALRGSKFDSEVRDLDEASMHSHLAYVMPDWKYFLHLACVSMMWTAASFSYYMMLFMTKYYEGSLYLNFYLDGIAGIIGVLIAYPILRWLKIKYTLILSLSFVIFFAVWFLLF